MKILIYSCHYYPEPIGIGKFTGETAFWLAARGHKVRCISAPPSYPQWKVADGYTGAAYQWNQEQGVETLRCPLWVAKGHGGAGRMLQYLSFTASSAPAVVWQGLAWRPDVILSVIPPTTVCAAAVVAAFIGGSVSWLHVQDFDIDAAFELNLLKSKALRQFMGWIERGLLNANHTISTITPRMRDRLIHKQVSIPKQLFPNWAEISKIAPMDGVSPLRRELGIQDTEFVALYSGNVGEKQGIGSLVEAAQILRDCPEIRVVIGGDGAGKARLTKMAEGLPNVMLIPLQPLERLNDLLNMADVHLLPQKAEAADLVMPSKLGGMLASGRPIIAGAAPGTQLADEVAACGIVVPPDDPRAIADAMLQLFHAPERRKALGLAARYRAEQFWNKEAILLRFEEALIRVVGRRRAVDDARTKFVQ